MLIWLGKRFTDRQHDDIISLLLFSQNKYAKNTEAADPSITIVSMVTTYEIILYIKSILRAKSKFPSRDKIEFHIGHVKFCDCLR
jgi:hypothetical protein